MAVGMSEREAQEAAISSFGPVRAVTRAHLARLTRRPAVLAMVAWKLVSLLLLAVGVSGMAAIMLTGLDRTARAAGLRFHDRASRITSDHFRSTWSTGAGPKRSAGPASIRPTRYGSPSPGSPIPSSAGTRRSC